MNYAIYSGYCKDVNCNKYAGMSADVFFPLWLSNTQKYSDAPIFTFGPDKPVGCTSIAEYPNIGHVDNSPRDLCGWTAGIFIGLMHAYAHNLDFVYKEQDCLWFGDCVGTMYAQIGDKGCCYGKNDIFGAANALFLVRHHFIREFIHHMSKEHDKLKYPEIKTRELPNSCTYDFGYDRDRPFYLDDVFYIQQISGADYHKIKHLL